MRDLSALKSVSPAARLAMRIQPHGQPIAATALVAGIMGLTLWFGIATAVYGP